jgi:ABC-2 type transport system ATP-binding protein/lipopolysaccharide transport system ATP-binding protein
VLAVGDAEYQARCLGKMREVEASGRTVLFVSHDLDAVARLCPKAFWIDHGRVAASGPTAAVIGAYVRPGDSSPPPRFEPDPRDAEAYVATAALLGKGGAPTTFVPVGEAATISIELVVRSALAALDVAVVVINARGVTVLDELLREGIAAHTDPLAPGRYCVNYPLPPLLSVGEYAIAIWVGGPYDDGEQYDRALSFTVDGHHDRTRTIRLDQPWSIVRMPD